MKKLTTLFLAVGCMALSLRADVILQEQFNYNDGPIADISTNLDGSTNWFTHSGNDDAFVSGHRLQNAATGGNLNRSGDVHRFFSAAYTNSPTIVYASFIVNCTNLPNAAGTYFAHFYTNSSSFYGRIFALVGTNLCLPNTYRLGVAGAAAGPSVIFPNDLATNQNYQVVIKWDPVNDFAATIWVNPASASDVNLESSDPVTVAQAVPVQAFAFRQASSFGNWFCTISNLVVATSFDEASTNVWASNSVPVSMVYDLKPITNYVGVPATLSVIAAGQGLADFDYLWQKNGAPFANPNGNSNVLPFNSPVLSDTGNYGVVVSNRITGATAASATVLMWVTNGPPLIAVQPFNSTNYPGRNATLSVTAYGTPTLTYLWTYNGGAATNADPTTTNTFKLVIPNVQTNNNTVGTYQCAITNAYGGTNTVSVTVSVIQAQVVNIDTLRGFVDPVFFLPTNTTLYYTVTNAVVYTREVTNADGSVNGGPFTAAPNAEFFIQDGTGGITVFVGGGAATQPRQGDIVNVTGPLGNFNSLLQFNMSASDGSQIVTITGHTNTLPAPVVLPFSFTNGVGFISVSNAIRKYEGRYATLTNVYFAGSDVGNTFASSTYIITNLSGESFRMFLNAANVNVIGQPIPQFAKTISGPMSYFNSTTATNRSSGFELDPSSYSDIAVGPATPTGVIAVTGGGVPTINWQAQPFVPYSILWATNVSGPYVPVASDLTFATTAGTFTDMVNTNLPASFYKISSP